MRAIIFLSVFFYFLSFSLKATNIEQLVLDLQEEWLCYEKKYNAYVAYLPQKHARNPTLHFWLPLQNYAKYNLVLLTKKDVYLFVEHKLSRKLSAGWHQFSLDSLQKIYPKNKIFISFYSASPNFIEKSFIGRVKVTENKASVKQNLEKKKLDGIKEKIFLYFVLILIAYAVVRQYDHKILDSYFSFSKLFQLQRRLDNPLYIRPFQLGNLLFLLAFAFTETFLLLLLNQESVLPKALWQWSERFSGLSWFSFFIFSIVEFLLKYLLIYVVAHLLGLARWLNIHFYEYLKVSNFLYVFLAFFMFLFSMQSVTQITSIEKSFALMLAVAYLLRSSAIAYNLNRVGEFRKLDFYAYLCITEIIPLLIYIKILLF
ncbi:MAG: DUF4271 domain-containing protein [Thermonemataceae bacterium]|nr:DUF4271 domain-containing protein [Thermonemataceae bacterium]